MYFSTEGREELVKTIDKLLIAKKLLVHKGKYFPDKDKYWTTEHESEIDRLDFFFHSLRIGFRCQIEFDPDQETTEGNYHEVHRFDMKLVELDEFSELLSQVKNPELWKDKISMIREEHLNEIYADGFLESKMDVELGTYFNVLHVSIESVAYCTFYKFFEGFLSFERELKEILLEMKQISQKKERKSA